MIIGITGRSGDGKSTFTNYLNQFIPNSKVITVDKIDQAILASHSEELIQLFGPEIINGNLLNINFISKHPEIRIAIHQISKNELINSIMQIVKTASEENVVLLIEWYRLTELKEVWEICDYHILVKSINPKKRYENIAKRGQQKNAFVAKSMEEELRIRDFSMPQYENFMYDYTIVNNYDERLLADAISISNAIKNIRTSTFDIK